MRWRMVLRRLVVPKSLTTQETEGNIMGLVLSSYQKAGNSRKYNGLFFYQKSGISRKSNFPGIKSKETQRNIMVWLPFFHQKYGTTRKFNGLGSSPWNIMVLLFCFITGCWPIEWTFSKQRDETNNIYIIFLYIHIVSITCFSLSLSLSLYIYIYIHIYI